MGFQYRLRAHPGSVPRPVMRQQVRDRYSILVIVYGRRCSLPTLLPALKLSRCRYISFDLLVPPRGDLCPRHNCHRTTWSCPEQTGEDTHLNLTPRTTPSPRFGRFYEVRSMAQGAPRGARPPCVALPAGLFRRQPACCRESSGHGSVRALLGHDMGERKRKAES